MEVAGIPAIHAALTCKAEWPSDVPSLCPLICHIKGPLPGFVLFLLSSFYLLPEIILRFPFVVYRCAVVCFGNCTGKDITQSKGRPNVIRT